MSGRWTLFFENPNMTAAVVAELAVLLLCLAGRVRAKFRWLPVAACCLSLIALAATGSRGGLVAFLSGVVAWTVAKGRECRWRLKEFVIPLAAVLSVSLVATACFGLFHRFGALAAGDASVNNRLLIWRQVPRMMADAPSGWGVGNAGKAFVNWYQPLDRTERYRTLVGSHATWMVEFGGWGRTLYAFGWLLVLTLAYRRLHGRNDPLPAAQWTALAVAAVPTSVLEQPVIWLLPVASSLPLVGEVMGKRALGRACWIGLAVLALVPQFLVWTAGAGSVRCRDGGGLVEYRPRGEGDVADWIVPSAEVVGEDFPRLLRKRGRSMGLAEALADVPANAERLVLCGVRERSDLSRFAQLREVVYLAPKFRLPKARQESGRQLRERFVVGEFSSGGGFPPPGVEVLPGTCDFMPEAALTANAESARE